MNSMGGLVRKKKPSSTPRCFSWNSLTWHLKNTASTSTLCVCIGLTKTFICIHRGSYLSALVLLNLLNELGKRDKMQGLPSILSLLKPV